MSNKNLRTAAEKLPEIAAALAAEAFRPPRLFRNGHAQTLLGYAHPRRFRFGEFKRDEKRIFEVAPGARLLARCRWQQNETARQPTIVLVHGLEGSSESVYLLGTARTAFAAGFNVVRLNLRTCGGTENLTSTLYHSGMSQDLRAVINELIERDKLQKIYLAGFSLGGNLTLKLTGEWGANAPAEFRGAAAISPSIDLAICAAAIERRTNWIYQNRFISSLKKRMRRIAKMYPEIYQTDRLKTIRTVRDFDRQFTAVHGGFRDAADYYAQSSALPFIEKIRVPTLIIHAQDDPFVPFESFRHGSLEENPFVVLLAPENGGHVGFISAARDGEKRFWAENQTVEFFRLLENL